MRARTKLLKNNFNDHRSDVEKMTEFYEMLQGKSLPEGMSLGKGGMPNLTEKQAYSVVWFLQEHLSVLPDNISQCDNCKELYDTYSEGLYWESKKKHYCGGCDHLVPYNFDRGVGIKKKKRFK